MLTWTRPCLSQTGASCWLTFILCDYVKYWSGSAASSPARLGRAGDEAGNSAPLIAASSPARFCRAGHEDRKFSNAHCGFTSGSAGDAAGNSAPLVAASTPARLSRARYEAGNSAPLIAASISARFNRARYEAGKVGAAHCGFISGSTQSSRR